MNRKCHTRLHSTIQQKPKRRRVRITLVGSDSFMSSSVQSFSRLPGIYGIRASLGRPKEWIFYTRVEFMFIRIDSKKILPSARRQRIVSRSSAKQTLGPTQKSNVVSAPGRRVSDADRCSFPCCARAVDRPRIHSS